MPLPRSYKRNQSLFAKPVRHAPAKKKNRIWYVLKTAFKRMCMFVGFLVLMSAVFGALSSSLFMKETKVPTVPDEAVLFLPLETAFVEHSDALGGYGFTGDVMTIRHIVDAIDKAARDERIKGFVVSHKGGVPSMAHIQELRAAVARFRESGKFTYFYSASYDSLGLYYLASAFEEIWMQPTGILSIPGIHAEMPYARAVLDRLGIEPQIFARKDYKNMFENLTDTKMSDASREALQSVVDTLADVIMIDIASMRDMAVADFAALVDKGLFMDYEAQNKGLIDVVDYGDVLNERLIEAITGDPESDDTVFMSVAGYNKVLSHENKALPGTGGKKQKIALIYVVGQIVQHNLDGANPLSSAESIVGALRAAEERDDIKAIVIRVDSPGGSPVASESIRRAVLKAKEKGKIVIVSMGEAAASGGYWISADADYIFALPTTFTGSIGVTGGKFSFENMWDKLLINWDAVRWGENATLWSFNHPYSESEAARMNMLMDDVYGRFVSIVAEGRDMSPEAVDNVAGGRVWLGAQAQGKGLVDALGGLDAALDYLAVQLGENDRNDLNVMVLPRPKTAFEKIVELLEMQASMGYVMQVQASLMQFFEPLLSMMYNGKVTSDTPFMALSSLPYINNDHHTGNK